MIRHDTIDTPVGPLTVAAVGERVVALAFADHFDRVAEPVRRRFPGRAWVDEPTTASRALAAYVAGDLAALASVEVEVAGTPFQQRVWAALRSIPTGRTWSYAELADAVGSPAAVRAVGTANGANPVWLVVPCHRVIRADGSLGGYGGGLDRKAWLLRHEGIDV